VALDDVSADLAGVARGKVFTDSCLALDGVEHRLGGCIDLHVEAVLLQMLDPRLAASAAWRSPHFDRPFGRGVGRPGPKHGKDK
jgi:hypothetical protein